MALKAVITVLAILVSFPVSAIDHGWPGDVLAAPQMMNLPLAGC